MQRQKDFLCHFLGRFAVVQEVVRQAEDHRLVPAHQFVKITVSPLRLCAHRFSVNRESRHLSSVE
jgi:hypothetical protein